MARLFIYAEGQTEETFVKELLRPHLFRHGYYQVEPRLSGTGGIKSWQRARRDILKYLKEDRERIVSTMVDYYALPQEEEDAWPGRKHASALPRAKRADHIAAELMKDIASAMEHQFNPERFVPFVLMHEFEALLFSDCTKLSSAIEQPSLRKEFQKIRDSFDTPEEIDDSAETAPSKRILKLLPTYQKPLFGNLAAVTIGLEAIRAQCPHFNRWLSQLESLTARGAAAE